MPDACCDRIGNWQLRMHVEYSENPRKSERVGLNQEVATVSPLTMGTPGMVAVPVVDMRDPAAPASVGMLGKMKPAPGSSKKKSDEAGEAPASLAAYSPEVRDAEEEVIYLEADEVEVIVIDD